MFQPTLRPIEYKPRYLLVVFALIILAVGVVNYVILTDSQRRIIEHEAVRIAEVATSQAMASRTVFTTAVVDKLAKEGFGAHRDYLNHVGMVPIPAYFLKLTGHEVNRTSGLYSYGPLSRWNIEPTQGVKDDFQRWAWAQLEQQDQQEPGGPIAWRPVWRFESVDGVRTLRYMRADPAANKSCVSCHNQMEREPETIKRRISDGIPLGKQWKQHQLLGALEAKIPVDNIDHIAADQAKATLALGLGIALCGFIGAAWLATRDARRERLAAAYFEQQSKFDPLTRLGNRAFFNEMATGALERARISGAKLAVLFIDLDYFKQINDTHGHHAGDRVLYETGVRLRECLRETDLVTRHGGDEFLVLLEAGVHRPNFDVLAQKLIEALERPIEVNGQQLQVSASIGISCFPQDGKDLTALIEKADAAMYEVKQQGRHGYRIWREGTPPHV